MKVVYGHTDSIYIKCDSVEKAKVAIEEINDHVRESFPNVLGLEQHPVVWEFEKFYPAEDYHQNYYQNNFLRYLAYKSGCQREEKLNKIWN